MPNQSSHANRRTVGKTVTYIGAGKKRKPAVITALSSNGGVVLRIGRYDSDSGTPGVQYHTLGNATTGILRRVNRGDTNVWTT